MINFIKSFWRVSGTKVSCTATSSETIYDTVRWSQRRRRGGYVLNYGALLHLILTYDATYSSLHVHQQLVTLY